MPITPARPALRQRHLLLRATRTALRAGRAGGRGGARRAGRARRPPGVVRHHRRDGARRRRAWPSSLSPTAADRPCSSRPTSRTPRWRPWACPRWPRGRCSRDAPGCGPARRCSCWAPVASSARSPCRPRRLLGAGRVVAAARSTARAGARHGIRRGCRGRPGCRRRTPQRSPQRLRDACGGSADVVVDPLAGIPGTAAALVLGAGGRLVNLGSAAGPGAVGRLGHPAQPVGRGAGLHQHLAHRRPATRGVRHRSRARRRRPPRGHPRRRAPRRAHRPPGTVVSRGTAHPTASSSLPERKAGWRRRGPPRPVRVVASATQAQVPVTVCPV